MRLTIEEFDSVDWDEFSIEEINCLIDMGCFTEDDMVQYYCNTQWRDQP